MPMSEVDKRAGRSEAGSQHTSHVSGADEASAKTAAQSGPLPVIRTSQSSDRMADGRVNCRRRLLVYRGDPEPLALVAKLDARKGRVELWLSGWPMVRTMERFMALRFSVQVFRFKRTPEEVGMFGAQGQFITMALVCRIEMSNLNLRCQEFKAVAQRVVHSLYGGDNVVVHCMTGLARGPMAAALLSAVAHNESLQVAMDRIERLRNTQLPDRAWGSMGGKWAVQAAEMELKLPRYPVGFAAVRTEAAVVHAVVKDMEERYIPLCKWQQGRVVEYPREPVFASTVSAIRQYSSKF